MTTSNPVLIATGAVALFAVAGCLEARFAGSDAGLAGSSGGGAGGNAGGGASGTAGGAGASDVDSLCGSRTAAARPQTTAVPAAARSSVRRVAPRRLAS